jgi:hypothetical protein
MKLVILCSFFNQLSNHQLFKEDAVLSTFYFGNMVVKKVFGSHRDEESECYTSSRTSVEIIQWEIVKNKLNHVFP